MQRQESPPSPGNGAPRQGLPWLLPWLLAEGIEETSVSKPENMGQILFLPTALSINCFSTVASCCFFNPFPSAANLCPVPLTAHSHTSERAHSTKGVIARGVFLPFRLALLRVSWPHPQKAAGSWLLYKMQKSQPTVRTTFLHAFYPLHWCHSSTQIY